VLARLNAHAGSLVGDTTRVAQMSGNGAVGGVKLAV
jgi:hypothetical protein